MKFYRIDTQTIMSGLVVRYRQANGYADIAEINASRDGVGISGSFPIMNQEAIETIKAVLDRAVEQHNTLKESYLPLRSTKQSTLPFESDPPCVVQLREAHFLQPDRVITERE